MAKQQRIPGTEGKSIKEIDDAAEHYVEQRDKRMKLTEKEVEAKKSLADVMAKHKLAIYRDDSASPPLVVMLTEGDAKIKVTRADEENDEAGSLDDKPAKKKKSKATDDDGEKE